MSQFRMTMASPQDSFIHFGCPRCTSPLKAPATAAGRRQRCPACYNTVFVPKKSRPLYAEQYSVSDEGVPAAAAQDEVAVFCRVCRTRMTALADQVGKEISCPDCGTKTIVSAPSEPKARRRLVPLEAYALCEDFDPASAGAANEPEYIPFHCSLCGTLMHATAAEVGSRLTCPDCGTTTAVPAPHAVRPKPSAKAAEVYGVHEESGQPGAGSLAEQPHVGFRCICGTRLHALVADAGHSIQCPDCGREVVIPQPPAPPRRTRPSEEAGGDYAVAVPIPALPVPPRFAWRRAACRAGTRGEPSESLAGGARSTRPTLPIAPPRWPMLSGVFGFPWHRCCRGRWIQSSLFASIIGFMAVAAWGLGRGPGMGLASAVPWVISMIWTASAICLAVAWVAVQAINGLVILSDTAAGNDDVRELAAGLRLPRLDRRRLLRGQQSRAVRGPGPGACLAARPARGAELVGGADHGRGVLPVRLALDARSQLPRHSAVAGDGPQSVAALAGMVAVLRGIGPRHRRRGRRHGRPARCGESLPGHSSGGDGRRDRHHDLLSPSGPPGMVLLGCAA